MKKFLNIFVVFIFMFLCCGAIMFPTVFSRTDADIQVFEINSYQKLQEAYENNYNNANAVLKLTANLDLTGEESFEMPDSVVFLGTFDGNGYQVTINKVNKTENGLYYGLFPRANGATIKNLKVVGDVEFEFDHENTEYIYAGVLVGEAENVKFENCELGLVNVGGHTGSIASFSAYSNVDFGVFAGKLVGNNSLDDVNVLNCASYYNINAVISKNVPLNVGGVVGVLEKGSILNTLSFGNTEISSTLTGPLGLVNYQNVGGVAGYAIGTNTRIKNTCYGGDINSDSENNVGLNTNVGAIIGCASSTSTPTSYNINFDYWTEDLLSVGAGLVLDSAKVAKVELINKAFLTETENFDNASPAWNFDVIWTMRDSNLRLQHFLTFQYSFANILDVTQVLQSAEFVDTNGNVLSAKYGEEINIKLTLKEQYKNFYSLTSVILNSNNIEMDLTGTKQEDGGYIIPIIVNDSTDGTYSFVMNADIFNCIVTVFDATQGGVKSTDATSSVSEMNLAFSYNSNVKRVTAVGSGIYAFDYWKCYYKNGDEWEEIDFDDYKYVSQIKILFGTAPFNKEFKLEAYFTSDKAVDLKFPSFNDLKVKSLKVSGQEYDGEPIKVSPNAIVNFEIITKKGYKLNYNKFLEDMKLYYGENTVTMISDPIENEETFETAYKFNLYMRNRTDTDSTEMELTFSIDKENSSNGGLAWWVYLLISVAVIGVIAGVVVIIIKKRGGGRKGGSSKAGKTTEKKTSYDDYYI